ncbi:MAG: DUF1028 domain-containing protein [Gemmataceae bacterium]
MKRNILGSVLSILVLAVVAAPARATPPTDNVNTFSIVAFDPDKKEWGVAVASKYLAVGAVVPYAEAGVGAIASQSAVNVTYGTRGLELLKKGKNAAQTLDILLNEDEGREVRQVAIIDAKGDVVPFTGKKCNAWAGSKAGKNYSCQGNLLAGEAVILGMAKAYESTKGPLAWRLMAALEAAEKEGGDKRGKQAAALLVVRAGAGPGGRGDRYLDLRVDDHREPVAELARILALRVRRPKAD